MYKQPWVSFQLAGVSLTDFGLEIPSPFSSLELSNSQINSMTSWTLVCTVGGDSTNKINVAAFEALLYSAAQAASSYPEAQGIPVSFSFGWLDEMGKISEYISYQGFTLTFKVSTNGLYMQYTINGFASLATQAAMPVLNFQEVSGYVQPSAVLEGILLAIKADKYYQLDIDHTDAPTYISHGPMTTSLNNYVMGSAKGEDEYSAFPGLVRLSKTYNGSRTAGGLDTYKVKILSQLMNHVPQEKIGAYLRISNTDTSPQCASYSYWIDEPTTTRPGTIHYKANAGLFTNHASTTLRYGTKDSNIITLSGSYSGVAYNMTDMKFATVGFTLDVTGNAIIEDARVVNSWSSSLDEVFQTANIINDVQAIASQFSGDFTVTIPGSVKQYSVAQPVSLIIMTGNTLSPASGIYNIVSVTHSIGQTFTTSLKIMRLNLSTANQVAANQNIYVYGSPSYPKNSYTTTSNIKSPYKTDFGEMYPDFTRMTST